MVNKMNIAENLNKTQYLKDIVRMIKSLDDKEIIEKIELSNGTKVDVYSSCNDVEECMYCLYLIDYYEDFISFNFGDEDSAIETLRNCNDVETLRINFYENTGNNNCPDYVYIDIHSPYGSYTVFN
jgi:hypothetical protein